MSGFDVFARFYDFEYGDYQEDVEFYVNFARRTGSPILDAACGTGRVLVPLAKAGFAVTGLDVSPAMVAAAWANVEKAGVKKLAKLVNADVRDFSLDERFELAFVALNSFGHLVSIDDQIAALRCLHEHLQEDGLLILDLFNPDLALLGDAPGHVLHDYTKLDPVTGNTIVKLHSTRLDQAKQLLNVTFFYDEVHPKGDVKRVIAPFAMRYSFKSEMELLLEKTDFQLENVYGSYDLDEYTAHSQKMIFVARALNAPPGRGAWGNTV